MSTPTPAQPVPRIFVSHASADDEFAYRLATNLRRALGGDENAVWPDSSDGPQGGDAWWERLVAELTARPIFVVLLSRAAMESRWVRDEIALAWQQKNSPAGKVIIPVLVEPIEVPLSLAVVQLVSFVPPRPYQEALAELLSAIRTGRAREAQVEQGPAPSPGLRPPPWPQPVPSAPAPPEPQAPDTAARSYAAPPLPTPALPATPPSSLPDEHQIVFTAYHPKEALVREWMPLLVYIALDTPRTLAAVAAAAAERLAGKREQFRAASSAEETWLRRGAMLTLVPRLPGMRANPPELTVAWEEDVQQHEFRVRAESAQPGHSVNGAVLVYTGPLLRAEIPVSIYIHASGTRTDLPEAFASAVARAYRRVFASYSHKDTAIVRACETAAVSLGDQFLRDATLLHSGEHWDDRLLRAVTDADLFQLFWSKHAALSPAVEREWRHALTLAPAREHFIRPVYWSRMPHQIPPELQGIHFERLDLARLRWGGLRRVMYAALGIG